MTSTSASTTSHWASYEQGGSEAASSIVEYE